MRKHKRAILPSLGIIALLGVLLSFSTSCIGGGTFEPTPKEESATPQETIEPAQIDEQPIEWVDETVERQADESIDEQTDEVEIPQLSVPSTKLGYLSDKEPLDNINWITPAKVEVSNFYAGARAECPLTIHNGNDEPMAFSVFPRLPDKNWEDYVDAPADFEPWVEVEASGLLLKARETKTIMISLELPEDVVIVTPHWEFWIITAEATNQQVTTELACRWLVNMR